ncbi:hypothetical protein [Alicyclobacillus macrosporangiidus]|jgi:type II secretory pathway pseudopilin PulG|uniref:Uncharacterized protein n=1 Tax=Alicyclobacillus macrosporangiidus TaxID=392015 RepID=A0A1I7JWR8_9BACL|nr:hypothetical protein [Alicyclobacillus macrosporangiidus]SFU89620.1 hypothetical protein SAMN05421543_11268 [Alicyclobacillus macrosporangiidus]
MTLWEVVLAVWMLAVASAGIFDAWYVGVESLRRAENQAAAMQAANLAAEHWLAGDPIPDAVSQPGAACETEVDMPSGGNTMEVSARCGDAEARIEVPAGARVPGN